MALRFTLEEKKMTTHTVRFTAALSAVVGLPAIAGGMAVGVEVPRLDVAEYHRP